MTEEDRAHLDYLRRILNGAMLYIDMNDVPASARVRNNIQNAISDINGKLYPTETKGDRDIWDSFPGDPSVR